MIPNFPVFIKLTPHLKTEIEETTKSFPPYSDHNFTSMFMWDVDSLTEFSRLNKNLIIKFKDYESDKIFYSFIGNNQPENTIDQLLSFSKNQGFGESVLLLPEHNFTPEQIQSLSKKFDLIEDRNNFDYILSTEEISKFPGGKYLNKRNKLNNFLKTHRPEVKINHLKDPTFRKELIQAFDDWISMTKNERGDSFVNYDEIKAFKKLIDNNQYFDILAIAVYIDGKIRGFSLFEIIDSEYAQHPFQKADFKYKGIYEFLYSKLGAYLTKEGIKYLNIYQDLGHEGLRRAKMDYNPTFLKKYTLSKKSPN